MADSAATQTDDAASSGAAETQQPQGNGNGKGGKGKAGKAAGGSGSAGGQVGPTDVELLDRLTAANQGLADAEAAVATAKAERDAALRALGSYLVPANAKRGEKFQQWIGQGDARRLYEVVVGRDNSFEVRERPSK